MNIKIALGKRIRMLREARGIKQGQLAGMIDFSVDGISLIERGENWPQLSTIEKFAVAFNIPATDLFDGLEIERSTKLPNQMARARATLARLPERHLVLAAELLETLERNATE